MLDVSNKTKKIIPKIGFEKMADFALGKKYVLSLVFIGKKKMRTLNLRFKGKDKPTNILSFPLSKKEGEIFICPEIIEKESTIVGDKYSKYLTKIFVHGITHLKGFEHGSIMEKEEEKILKKFLF